MGKKVIVAMLLFCSFVSAEAQTLRKKIYKQNHVSVTARVANAEIATKPEVQDPDNLAGSYFSQIMGVAAKATSNIKLYQFIEDWVGTPYRLGGDTKRGIDCSGFAYQLYDKVFNTAIGNNSRNIFSMVNPIDKEELQEGDLVFFKIKSRSISHIGVYIGNNKFAHAASRGVMISNLDEPYWKRYYYKGGRLLESLRDRLEEN